MSTPESDNPRSGARSSSYRTAPRRNRYAFGPSVGFAAVGALMAACIEADIWSWIDVSWVVAGLSLVSLGVLANRYRPGILALPTLYAGCFAVFHFGLILPDSLGLLKPEDPAFGRVLSVLIPWLRDPLTRKAALVSAAGLAAFVSGALMLPHGGQGDGRECELGTSAGDRFAGRRLENLGMGALVFGIGAWLALVGVKIGLGGLTGSYEAYRVGIEGSAMVGWAYYSVGVGVVLLAAAGPSGPIARLGSALFGVWSLVAMPLGLRGEVLFPLATAAGLLNRRRTLIGVWSGALVGVLLLTVIAGLREVRQVGVMALVGSPLSVARNPLFGLAELGGTLRPVRDIMLWHDQGDPLLLGGSYWAPIERGLAWFVPGIERTEGAKDERLSNVLVKQRKRGAGIGFSPVAEAYRNFGSLGVIGVMWLYGLVIGFVGTLGRSPRELATAGVVFFPLLVHVRNSFAPVPAQVLLGVLLVQLATARRLPAPRSA